MSSEGNSSRGSKTNIRPNASHVLSSKISNDHTQNNTHSYRLGHNSVVLHSSGDTTQSPQEKEARLNKQSKITTGRTSKNNGQPFFTRETLIKSGKTLPGVIVPWTAEQLKDFKEKQNVTGKNSKESGTKSFSFLRITENSKNSRRGLPKSNLKQLSSKTTTKRGQVKKQNVGGVPQFPDVTASAASYLPAGSQINPKVETFKNTGAVNDAQTNNFGAISDTGGVGNAVGTEAYLPSQMNANLDEESFDNGDANNAQMATNFETAKDLGVARTALANLVNAGALNGDEAIALKHGVDTQQQQQQQQLAQNGESSQSLTRIPALGSSMVSNPRHYFIRPVHRYLPVQHKYVGGVIHRYINPSFNGNLGALVKSAGGGITNLIAGGEAPILHQPLHGSVLSAGQIPGSIPKGGMVTRPLPAMGPINPEMVPGPLSPPGAVAPEMIPGPLTAGPPPNRVVVINRPVHHIHQMKVPMPVAVPGPPPPPKFFVINRPVPMPPRRVPFPVVIQQPPRLVIVRHHPSVIGKKVLRNNFEIFIKYSKNLQNLQKLSKQFQPRSLEPPKQVAYFSL